jgi:hypothetical protein
VLCIPPYPQQPSLKLIIHLHTSVPYRCLPVRLSPKSRPSAPSPPSHISTTHRPSVSAETRPNPSPPPFISNHPNTQSPSMKVKPTSSRRSSDAYHPYPPPASPHSFAEPDLPNRHTPAGGSAPGGDEQQYKVARAISSCTRCRQRKQKCDGKLPACTACERAKVECIGFDAISKTNISRK